MTDSIGEKCSHGRGRFWKCLGIRFFRVVAVSFQMNMRHSSPANNFCKTARCPSSQTLLRYRRHRLPIADRAEIQIHLHACDFCNAELQLLTRHRNYVEESRVVEMPGQLRRLAEDLLTRSTVPFGLIGFDTNRQSH
jgi:hypothetical protein